MKNRFRGVKACLMGLIQTMDKHEIEDWTREELFTLAMLSHTDVLIAQEDAQFGVRGAFETLVAVLDKSGRESLTKEDLTGFLERLVTKEEYMIEKAMEKMGENRIKKDGFLTKLLEELNEGIYS